MSVLDLTLRAKFLRWRGELSSSINLFKLSLLHSNSWHIEEFKT